MGSFFRNPWDDSDFQASQPASQENEEKVGCWIAVGSCLGAVLMLFVVIIICSGVTFRLLGSIFLERFPQPGTIVAVKAESRYIPPISCKFVQYHGPGPQYAVESEGNCSPKTPRTEIVYHYTIKLDFLGLTYQVERKETAFIGQRWPLKR